MIFMPTLPPFSDLSDKKRPPRPGGCPPASESGGSESGGLVVRWEVLHRIAQSSADNMYLRGGARAYHREYQSVIHSQPCDMAVPICQCEFCK